MSRESGFSALLPMDSSHYMKKKSIPRVKFCWETRTEFNLGLCSTENVSHLSVIEMPYQLWQQSSCVHPGNFYPSCFPLLFFTIIVPTGREPVEHILFGLHQLSDLYMELHSWVKGRCRLNNAKKLRTVGEDENIFFNNLSISNKILFLLASVL